LDHSRTYYDEVLNRAVIFFPDDATVALVGGETQARTVDQSNEQLTGDAALFLRHVAQADESRKGSYQWLADLLPEN
ncbi:MAG: hypothetical protein AAF408_07185, partial [Pseudomonadota bacterium]